jgi:hypothetical protein
MTIDQDKLTDFLHKFVGDLGATMAAGNVLLGDRLGAQAGEEPIRRLAADAGYTRFRRVAETPFNIVYEVRP